MEIETAETLFPIFWSFAPLVVLVVLIAAEWIGDPGRPDDGDDAAVGKKPLSAN
jgi:hypothetical protein